MTEHHLRAAFLDRMCELGTSQFAQQGTFTVIDPGRAVPVDDQRPRARREGDAVALAGGVLWAGYEGSLARTWWCGDGRGAGHGRTAAFARWRAVTDAVIEQCRPGAHGCRPARRVPSAGGAEPQMTIAYAVGLGHEGPIAGPGMSPELERAQAIEAGHGARGARTSSAAPERLLRRGHGARHRRRPERSPRSATGRSRRELTDGRAAVVFNHVGHVVSDLAAPAGSTRSCSASRTGGSSRCPTSSPAPCCGCPRR